MNVVLQVSVRDLIVDLANGNDDPFLKEILAATDQLQKNSSNAYLDDFFAEYKRLKQEKGLDTKLASTNLFGNQKNADKFDLSSTDAEVEKKIRQEIDAKIAVANKIIRQRIDRFGVSSPNVQRIEGSGRILVELPGVKDAERVKELLQSTAKLEFWEVVVPGRNQATVDFIGKALGVPSSDSTAGTPLNTAEVNKMLKSPAAKSKLPGFLRKAKFLWGSKVIKAEDNQKEYLDLYIVKGQANGSALMSGDIVQESSAERDLN
ncbi:unnamed protein product, partial [Cyprideis torosa]